MAYLNYKTGLTAWIDVNAFLGADGATSFGIGDLAAANAWASLGGLGTYRASVGPNGSAAVEFDGVADSWTLGAALSTLCSNVAATIIAVCQPTGITLNNAARDRNHLVWGTDSGLDEGPSLLFQLVSGTTPTALLHGKVSAGPQTTISKLVTVNRPHIFCFRHDASTMYLDVDGTAAGQTIALGTMMGFGNTFLIGCGPSIGGVRGYFKGYLFELLVYNAFLTTPNLGKVVAYLQSKYFSPSNAYPRDCYPAVRGDSNEQMRDELSRYVFLNRGPRLEIEIVAPPSWGDRDIGERITVAHPAGYDPNGAGGGWPNDAPRTFEIIERQMQPDKTVRLRLRDTQAGASASDPRYYESGRTTRISGNTRDGNLVLAKGVWRNNSRQTTPAAWYRDPASDTWKQLTMEGEGVSPYGVAVFRTRANILKRSSFLSGSTGITLQNGSGTVALDTTAAIFGTDTFGVTSPQCLLFTAGNPNVTGPVARWPVSEDTEAGTSFFWFAAGGVKYGFVVILWEEMGATSAGIQFSLKSSSYAKWYNEANHLWDQAAEHFISIPHDAAKKIGSSNVQAYVFQFFKGGAEASPNTLSLAVKMADGGTALRQARSYHHELRFANTNSTQRAGVSEGLIVTDAAGIVLVQDIVLLRQAATGMLPAVRGTVRFRVKYDFLAGTLTANLANASVSTLFNAYGATDSSKSLVLYVLGTGAGQSGTLRFRHVDGAATDLDSSIDASWWTSEQSIAITWDGTAVAVYRNGALIASGNVAASLVRMNPLVFTDADASFRDVAVYEDVRTSEEISAWAADA